jgi:hypothetical protein
MQKVTGDQLSGKGEIAKSGEKLRRRHFGVQKELRHSRFVVSFDARERSFPEPLSQKGCFLAAVVFKRLLGICFLRGVPADVVEWIGEGEKGGRQT